MFVRTMTEKLLTYAVGRGLTATDMPVVRKVVREAAPKQYRFSALVLGIVNSAPFQMRLKAGGAADPSRGALTNVGGSPGPAEATDLRRAGPLGPADEDDEPNDMFITKTSLSRRAILRGMGASLALPFLDAMVPAATALARTAGDAGAALRRGVHSDG